MASSTFFQGTKEVRSTVDFHRILNIPQREHTPAELEHIRVELTKALKRPGGKMDLFSEQAQVLHDAGLFGGGVGIISVGCGKTLTSLLLPAVMHPEPIRPLLVTLASLVDKTRQDRAELSVDWQIPKSMQITSYEKLGRVDGSNFLDRECRPDFIVFDEAHRAKNPKASVTRRLKKYMEANPKTQVVILTGTLLKASLKDAAHLITWALKDKAPVPKHGDELMEWADALDESARVIHRVAPGALWSFVSPEDKAAHAAGTMDRITAVRRGFNRRLVNTPGVVKTTGAQVDSSLNITGLKYDVKPETEANFEKLRKEWCTPDDWQLDQAMEVWRVARELSIGLHYIWDPRAPDEWRVRRKIWHQFVRDTLKGQRTLDSEKQVADACMEGGYWAHGVVGGRWMALDASAFDAWSEIRPSFRPRSKAVWHDDTVLNLCQKWAEKNDGIIWSKHGFFAQELARRTGLPYFGEGGLDAKTGQDFNILARGVLEKKQKPMPVIASMDANSTGRNLQGWNTNLVVTCPTGAAEWEQLLGRTHRTGQTADEVSVEVLIGCHEHIDAWDKANALAKATQDTQGTSQKLCIATSVMPDLRHERGFRWEKSKEEKSEE